MCIFEKLHFILRKLLSIIATSEEAHSQWKACDFTDLLPLLYESVKTTEKLKIRLRTIALLMYSRYF